MKGRQGDMINISGKFVYQPPSTPAPDLSFPATFLICLVIVADDGVPVFDPKHEPHARLSATVVMGYPQGNVGEVFPLTLRNLAILGPASNFVNLIGMFDTQQGPLPPAGWMPAAISVQLDHMWGAIITAAAPAPANSGIAIPIRTQPPATE